MLLLRTGLKYIKYNLNMAFRFSNFIKSIKSSKFLFNAKYNVEKVIILNLNVYSNYKLFSSLLPIRYAYSIPWFHS